MTASPFSIVIMAKAPIPGKVKTRLRPEFTDDEAAMLAGAALSDTIAAALACTTNVSVALERFGSRSVPKEVGNLTVIDQQGEGLGARLDHALEASWHSNPGRNLVIGMDTPQVTPELLTAVVNLAESPRGCGIGLADDGGFWALAFAGKPAPVLAQVPMSRADTGALTVTALRAAEYTVRIGHGLADVDDATSAAQVAQKAPNTLFARKYREITRPL